MACRLVIHLEGSRAWIKRHWEKGGMPLDRRHCIQEYRVALVNIKISLFTNIHLSPVPKTKREKPTEYQDNN